MKLSEKFQVPGDVALLYDFANSLDLRRCVEQGIAHDPGDAASRGRVFDLRPVIGRATSGLGGVLAGLVRLSDSGRLERVKTCASDECRWVFYDRSKPGNRRWCSSDRCGNREKTRTYRKRQRLSV
jgi:CGNR zinc finger protein